MDAKPIDDCHRELQSYVGWSQEDARRISAAAPALEPYLPGLVDDFYDEIRRHPGTMKVLTGGRDQIERLKGTLMAWVRELLGGRYDAEYVERRWRVGWRHVEIGLDQVFTNVALARLRAGLTRALEDGWRGDVGGLMATSRSLHMRLDLDLAIIEDAYQAEYAARLQRSERLATLGQVAGGVAHELRNPLNVVKTSVYYLLHALSPTPEKQAEHLRRIERHVEVADDVIESLSSFARMPAPDLHPVPIGRVVREALELNPPGDGIGLAVEGLDGLPPVLGDVVQLRIAFGNLLRNARDAMASGGRLSIACRRADGAIEVAVTDTGAGIPSGDLTRIMEPLYSTKARGLGLGLAIARSILARNRGGLEVESELGRGSTFTVRLTAAPGTQGGPA